MEKTSTGIGQYCSSNRWQRKFSEEAGQGLLDVVFLNKWSF